MTPAAWPAELRRTWDDWWAFVDRVSHAAGSLDVTSTELAAAAQAIIAASNDAHVFGVLAASASAITGRPVPGAFMSARVVAVDDSGEESWLDLDAALPSLRMATRLVLAVGSGDPDSAAAIFRAAWERLDSAADLLIGMAIVVVGAGMSGNPLAPG